MFAITNVKIFDGEKFIADQVVHFQNGIIINTQNQTDADHIIDGNGAFLCPGFVDVHIHGSFGADVMNPGGVKKLASCLPKIGTTAFCPTSVANTIANTNQFLGEVKKSIETNDGAKVLGAHLEGPYLSIENRGAHDISVLCDPLLDHYDQMVDGYHDIISRVSLAPERAGSRQLIEYLKEKGIAIAAAHTNASAKLMEETIQAGLTIATHAFNGYYPFHHREENAISVILTDPRIVCEFIPDLQHITKYAIRLLLASKGTEKTFICSDSCSAGSMPDGNYYLGRLPVYVENSIAHLQSDGRLAGSTISVLQGITNLVMKAGVSLDVALRLATSNPAKSIHLDHKIGRIQSGFCADFVLLDKNLQLLKTFINGNCVYASESNL